MSLWRRILAVLIMVFSALLFIACIAGIAGTWMVGNSLTNDLVQILTGVENGLGVVDEALGQIDTQVGNARGRVADFEGTVQAAGENVAENPVLLAALSERLDLGIAPAVNELRETVQSIRETMIGIQKAIEAVNALPFVSVGSRLSDHEQLQQLAEGITALTAGVEETRNSIRDARAEAADRTTSAILGGTSRLDGGLATIQTATTSYGTQVAVLLAAVSQLRARVALWLDVAAVIATLILLWVILSQVVTFVLGLSLFKGKNLFDRWVGSPAQ